MGDAGGAGIEQSCRTSTGASSSWNHGLRRPMGKRAGDRSSQRTFDGDGSALGREERRTKVGERAVEDPPPSPNDSRGRVRGTPRGVFTSIAICGVTHSIIRMKKWRCDDAHSFGHLPPATHPTNLSLSWLAEATTILNGKKLICTGNKPGTWFPEIVLNKIPPGKNATQVGFCFFLRRKFSFKWVFYLRCWVT